LYIRRLFGPVWENESRIKKKWPCFYEAGPSFIKVNLDLLSVLEK
jgi:hypothetical protein